MLGYLKTQAIFEPNLSPYKYPKHSQPVTLHTYPPMKMEQIVPKRRHIKFRRRGITQKKAYNMGFLCCIVLKTHSVLEVPHTILHANASFANKPMSNKAHLRLLTYVSYLPHTFLALYLSLFTRLHVIKLNP